MTFHPARVAAGVSLAATGLVVGVATLAIVLARLLVNAGMPVHPGDLATLDDVVAVLPFVATFAIANIVGAFGLMAGAAWSDRLAFAVAGVGAVVGAFGLFLIVAGRDPSATGSAARAFAEGVGIVGTFTIGYLLVLGLVAAARRPVGRTVRGVA